MTKKIGILGGSFDPIHNAHLAMAKTALKKFKLDEIIFVPTGIQPLKRKIFAPKKDRLNMVRLATGKNSKFKVSRIELDRKGISYAVDTFRKLKRQYKNAKLYYIIGMDSLRDLPRWKRPEELLEYCELIVFGRPGFMDISATQIRKRLKAKRSIKNLIPPKVLNYIKKKGLYGR